jgi:hypothetical protein
MVMNNPPPMQQFRPKKKSGISRVGMVFIIIGAIVFITIVAGSIMLVNTVQNIGNMMEPTSRVTTYIPTEKDKQALEKKITELEKIQQDGGEYTMVVTPSDINTYISNKESSGSRTLEPKFRVDIQGDVLSGMISVPIKDDESGVVKYFNGEAQFTAALNAGKLDVRLKDVLIKGKKPPFLINIIIDQFKKENLAKELNRNPSHSDIREKLERCKNLAIKDGKAYVTLTFPKPEQNDENKKLSK